MTAQQMGQMMRHSHNLDPREQGAALLSILLLVAILAVVAATTLDRVQLATSLAKNDQSMRQARMLAYSAEAFTLTRIADLRAANTTQTTLAGGWHNQARTFSLPQGTVRFLVRDGGNCFNLNSLVKNKDGGFIADERARMQFENLMAVLGIDAASARVIAAGAADWADSDTSPLPGGAEDAQYRAQQNSHRTPNRPFSHASELRAIKGVTPAFYAKLVPLICALPATGISPINVNTLDSAQAPLLVMLFPPGALSLDQARSYIQTRPASGYGSLVRFWDGFPANQVRPAPDVQNSVKLITEWFVLDMTIRAQDGQLRQEALIDARTAPPRMAWRNWGTL